MRAAACRVLVAVLAVVFLPGCVYVTASGTFGPYLDRSVVERIVPGQTTKAEVLALLGPPEEFLRSEVVGSLGDDTTRLSGAIALGNIAQDAFTYQYDRLEGGATLLLFYNRTDVQLESDLLVIFFDPDDSVRELGFRSLSEAP